MAATCASKNRDGLQPDEAATPYGSLEDQLAARGTGVFMPLTFRTKTTRSRRRNKNKAPSEGTGVAAAGDSPTPADVAELALDMDSSTVLPVDTNFLEVEQLAEESSNGLTLPEASASSASLTPAACSHNNPHASQPAPASAPVGINATAKSGTDVDALMQQVQLLLANMEPATAAAVAAMAARAAAAPGKQSQQPTQQVQPHSSSTLARTASAHLQAPLPESSMPVASQSLQAPCQSYLLRTGSSSSSSNTAAAIPAAPAELHSTSTICPPPLLVRRPSLPNLTKAPSQPAFQTPFTTHNLGLGALSGPVAFAAAAAAGAAAEPITCYYSNPAGLADSAGSASTPELHSLVESSLHTSATTPGDYVDQLLSCSSVTSNLAGGYNQSFIPPKQQQQPMFRSQQQQPFFSSQQQPLLPAEYFQQVKSFDNQGNVGLGFNRTHNLSAQGGPGFAPRGLQGSPALNVNHVHGTGVGSPPLGLGYLNALAQPAQAYTVGYGSSAGAAMLPAPSEILECGLGQLGCSFGVSSQSSSSQVSSDFCLLNQPPVNMSNLTACLNIYEGEFSLVGGGYLEQASNPDARASLGFGWA